MLQQWKIVLETASKKPTLQIKNMSLLTEASNLLLPCPTDTLHWDDYKGAITDIFGSNAKAHPNIVCVVETGINSDRIFSFSQINVASNLVAYFLLNTGIQREDVIVLYSYRGVDLVIAIMGVLKAGATFSVIDPAYPIARQIVYLSVAKPRGLVILAKAGHLEQEVQAYCNEKLDIICTIPQLEINDDGILAGGVSADGVDLFDGVRHIAHIDPDIIIGSDSIGTLIFTSGSTGIPKGTLK